MYNKKTIIKFITNVFLYFFIFSTNILTLKNLIKILLKWNLNVIANIYLNFVASHFFIRILFVRKSHIINLNLSSLIDYSFFSLSFFRIIYNYLSREFEDLD